MRGDKPKKIHYTLAAAYAEAKEKASKSRQGRYTILEAIGFIRQKRSKKKTSV